MRMNGWEFHYKGWSGGHIKGLFQEHATPNKLFPNNCLGKLDVDMLKQMRM